MQKISYFNSFNHLTFYLLPNLTHKNDSIHLREELNDQWQHLSQTTNQELNQQWQLHSQHISQTPNKKKITKTYPIHQSKHKCFIQF